MGEPEEEGDGMTSHGAQVTSPRPRHDLATTSPRADRDRFATSARLPDASTRHLPTITPHGAQFVLGNLNVLKAGSRAEAEAWAQGDPHVAAEGYESLFVFLKLT